MTARQVDSLLDERARLVAQRSALQGHLWAAEHLLLRVSKVLPTLIAPSPYSAVARDTLVDEIRELLTEDREHPGASVLLDAPEASPAALVGDIEQDGTS